MTVYVDDKQIPYGRMKMCHCAADTKQELLDMMTKIGMSHKHIQAEDTWREHFDISKAMRTKAVKAGAVEVTSKELVYRMRDKLN